MTDSVQTESSGEQIEAILEYWFKGSSAEPDHAPELAKKWFVGTPDQDRELDVRFGGLVAAAAAGKLDSWAETPRGRLALIILLDQLPRSLFRSRPEAFAQDPRALELCLGGLQQRQDETLAPLERIFLLMPMQHAESREIQARSVEACERLAATDANKSIAALLRNTLDSALEHKAIVDRFGRFPHRNRTLDRESTDEEIAFLAAGGSSFGQ